MGQNPWPVRQEEVLSYAKQTKVAWEYAWAVLKTIKLSNVSCERVQAQNIWQALLTTLLILWSLEFMSGSSDGQMAGTTNMVLMMPTYERPSHYSASAGLSLHAYRPGIAKVFESSSGIEFFCEFNFFWYISWYLKPVSANKSLETAWKKKASFLG